MLYNIIDIMFLKKSDKKVYFFAQKFAYVVDFLYLCSVIGKYTLFYSCS